MLTQKVSSEFLSLSDVLQREQKEMFAQLANLQSDSRVSYGNDALMPDSTAGLDLLPDTQGFGFIHPESFNQPNTQNEGMCSHTQSWTYPSSPDCYMTVWFSSVLRAPYGHTHHFL